MRKFRPFLHTLQLACLGVAFPLACAAGGDADDAVSGTGGNGNGNGNGNGSGGTVIVDGGNTGTGGNKGNTEPETCADAALNRTYVGCDFWPTVTFNPVYSVFDFAAVVANTTKEPAEVKVQRGDTVITTATIAPGGLEKLFLPWVKELKGNDFKECTQGGRPTQSQVVKGGAYHLTATRPVTVWQFNPLEYRAGAGGPPGKNWTCPYPPAACNGDGKNCESVSNDASLLIPTTAMTGNYRVLGRSSMRGNGGMNQEMDEDTPGSVAITGTENGTVVTVTLSAQGAIAGGTGVSAAKGGSEFKLNLNAGDVVQLLGERGPFSGERNADLSGSLIRADKPVQVIATNAITSVPSPSQAGQCCADHLEETVLPVEVLGNHYLVAPPSTARGTAGGHIVRFYGHVDGTTLTYPSGAQPAGAPTNLGAGQVIEIGPITEAFEVRGSQSFAVGSIMQGGQVQDPGGYVGDPSFSIAATVEQFRNRYTFLAPDDYVANYADIIMPKDAQVKLDEQPLSGTSAPIGSSGWVVVREKLGPGQGGAHLLTSQSAVSLQVMGFGHATSYYYPGGLNLKKITPPPPPPG